MKQFVIKATIDGDGFVGFQFGKNKQDAIKRFIADFEILAIQKNKPKPYIDIIWVR